MRTLKRWTGSLLVVLLAAGCGASAAQLSLTRDLKAATSRSTGCPEEELSISQHRPRLQSWRATGCQKSYSCVSINLELELAECKSNAVAEIGAR